jgi:predicted metalloprotease
MAVGGGGLGLVAVVLIAMFFGVDPSVFLGGSDPGGSFSQEGSGEITPADERAAEFVSVTLADTEEIWAGIFREQIGQEYRPVTLVLFKGRTQSACGGASGQTGPFYCPADKKVYLDTAVLHDAGAAARGGRGLRRGLCGRARGGSLRAGRPWRPRRGSARSPAGREQ